MDFSLSTCWNSHRHTDGQAMLEEIAVLGFSYAELSHGISMSLMEGVQRSVDQNIIKISSLHNFCPLPPGASGSMPNFYEPTHTSPAHARLWQEFTCRTIDFAEKLGARAVVLHLGSVHFLWKDPSEGIEAYAMNRSQQQLEEDESYVERLTEAFEAIRPKSLHAKPFLYRNLEAIVPYAQKRGIQLGFENREGLLELPLDEQFVDLLNDFSSSGVGGYWHDTGHAQIKAHMGILDVKEHLQMNGPKLVGCHLHDVVDGKDHRAPGTGTVDFSLLKPFLKANTPRVMELSPSVSAEEILASRGYLKKNLG
jgi:sugar phosphate isomerase/epimerase